MSHSAASPAMACGQITALRGSLVSLAHMAVRPANTRQLTADLMTIEAHLAALKGQAGQAGGAFSAQATQLVSALNHVTKAAHAMAMNPTQSHMAALDSAVVGLKAKAGPMIAEIRAVCPGA